MGRLSTLPPKWNALAEALGGVGELAKRLDVSYATLFRIARGQTFINDELKRRVVALAAEKRVSPPVDIPKKPSRTVDELDLEILEELGRCIRSNMRIGQDFIGQLARRIGDAALIKLAESDNVPPDVHIAVSKLLGL